MKKISILLAIIISSTSLWALDPMVRIFQNDGNSKVLTLSDIENITMIKSNNNYVMKIYGYKKITWYPVEIIDKIQFDTGIPGNELMNIYIKNYPNKISLSGVDSILFVIDEFQPVTIGNQVWMLKNLNVDRLRNGIAIPEAKDSATWLSSIYGAWCYYDNNPANGPIYGKLYNWYAVYDPRGLAPMGWHLPSVEEWDTLIAFLGGEDMAGGKSKESGTAHWETPNTGATNESGLTCLPGGYRLEDCSFGFIGKNGYWWTSTKYDSPRAWARFLLSYDTDFFMEYFPKENGFSVRCIKD